MSTAELSLPQTVETRVAEDSLIQKLKRIRDLQIESIGTLEDLQGFLIDNEIVDVLMALYEERSELDPSRLSYPAAHWGFENFMAVHEKTGHQTLSVYGSSGIGDQQTRYGLDLPADIERIGEQRLCAGYSGPHGSGHFDTGFRKGYSQTGDPRIPLVIIKELASIYTNKSALTQRISSLALSYLLQR